MMTIGELMKRKSKELEKLKFTGKLKKIRL